MMPIRIPSLLLTLAVTKAQESSTDQPGSGTWTDQVKCIVNLESDQPSLIDEATCTTQTDANSQPCLWCDLSSLTGSGGVCVNSAIKEILGAYWDQLCIEGSGSAAPDGPATPPVSPPLNPLPVPIDPPIISSPPSKLPTMSPVTTTPIAPAPDNGFSGAFSCATDDSSRMINDEETCLAKTDVTSSTGQKCVWCPVPFVGGGCITNSDASSIRWMCRAFEQIIEGATEKNSKHLRGNDVGILVGGWETLDPSCLGDLISNNGFDAEKESCSTRQDKSGNSCIWCDGAGVLGYCVSPMQRDAFAGYMDCSDAAGAFTAVN